MSISCFSGYKISLRQLRKLWIHRDAEVSDKNTSLLNYYSHLDEADLRSLTNEIRVKWIQSVLPQNSRILDIGCSDGLFVRDLSRAGYLALGMDISFAMLSERHTRYGVKIIQADFEKPWPYPLAILT